VGIFVAQMVAPEAARAQVNVEALRSDLDEHPVYVAVQASFAGHVGNVNGAVASGAGFAGINFGRHTLFVKAQGDYAEFSGKATIAKAFGHARYDIRLLPFLYAEVFAQIEENQFQRLALRQVDGVGLRFGIVQTRPVKLYFGTAWMLDFERLNGEFVFGGGPQWFAQRLSTYLAGSFRLNDRARFADALYFQPRINAPVDFRLLNDATFVVDIDKRFSAKIDCQVHDNNAPPVAVRRVDVDTVTSLVLTL
jgi:hypothetical protein